MLQSDKFPVFSITLWHNSDPIIKGGLKKKMCAFVKESSRLRGFDFNENSPISSNLGNKSLEILYSPQEKGQGSLEA